MFPPEDTRGRRDENHAVPNPPDSPDSPGALGSDVPADQAPTDVGADDEADNEADEDALLDWKDQLREEFEAWLETVDALPDLEADAEPPDTPDLYAFYAQWAAANAETRKGNRRTVEAFSQWGDTLARFEGDLKLLREQWQRLSTTTASEGLSRANGLVLVELLDRLQRVARAFDSTPRASWWGGAGGWRRAWESQRQAFQILVGHFESLLRKEGLTRLETTGQPFDPAAMTAVAAGADASRPDQSILEELAPGYRLRGELLRPAHVKVNRTSNSKT
jgi:molecular chaperone GrpE (heat shock protein)